MPVSGPIPPAVLTLLAAATLFTVMFGIGLAIVPGEFRWVWRNARLLAKALVSALILMPLIAMTVARCLAVSYPMEIGIMLMAIAPGAPVALRRSLDAGGHRAFAPALQISLAVLAVVSMPLWIAALNVWYAGHAAIAPGAVARQVFTAQLLPLCAGIAARKLLPKPMTWLEPRLGRIGAMLLILFALLLLVDVMPAADVQPRNALAVFLITCAALGAGHWLGGPVPATRTATAISTATRNPGLAFLVATVNAASADTVAAVLGYLLVSVFTVLAYVAWRKRVARAVNAAP